ncbi:UbiX family flavin prenyltransferase [Methanotrichaceae archaeon M04Ac]|uniref:Flavin prenyltransferase UbiX n=1 Tax=Candidatus Methanocrinis alkalitolerans TaxID=3033395 RepID=A0ABT5XFE9_9EURY|nr:UbiX family flavin prenyltransferase [Candidatus Methanocrinis alkalitolerans]MCR3883037.1 UbiX family flavin prenyltransferase [Methanothrix sp.]MDF0593445.1 UbiX family flavin prenyltransferase [Candidatus Methanocrinis alkalitolerans]
MGCDSIQRKGKISDVVVGISGASGVVYGIRLLEVLAEMGSVTHLVMTDAARKIIEIETEESPIEVEMMADRVYSPRDFTASIASGSNIFDAMVVAPCSMRTLAGIANGVSDTLITRAADVCLKERRRLILVTRESPLNLVHLKNMVAATEAGAIILPPSPGFYTRPERIEEMVDAVVGRVLDLLGAEHDLYKRWKTPLSGNAYNDENQMEVR